MAESENDKLEQTPEEDEKIDEENQEDQDEAEGETKLKSNKKRLLALAAIPVILCLLGLAAYFGGFIPSKDEDSNSATAQITKRASQKAAKGAVDDGVRLVIELDEFIVNLRVNGSQPRFLKMRMALQYVGSNNTANLQKSMPVIRDRIIVYLRELRAEDLHGAEGMYRVKSELLVRLNKLLYPIPVQDIYFKEILVQ